MNTCPPERNHLCHSDNKVNSKTDTHLQILPPKPPLILFHTSMVSPIPLFEGKWEIEVLQNPDECS